MPTKSDGGGLVGMRLVGERFALAREQNPDLGLLGAVLFATGIALARRARRAPRGDGSAPSAASRRCSRPRSATRSAPPRTPGASAGSPTSSSSEVAAQPAWWAALREGTSKTSSGRRLSPTAASVAGDYRDLGVELLTLLRAAEETTTADHRPEQEATS